jgi:O-antigen ligase
MSKTAVAWLLAYVILSLLTLRRSSFGIPLYLLTFYALPTNWWWGEGALSTIGERWALGAGIVFLVGVLIDGRTKWPWADAKLRPIAWLIAGYAVNATLVHFLLAADAERSYENLVRVWKFSLFLLLVLSAIQDRFDFKLAMYAIVVGGLYLGYEAYFNGAGRMRHGRLEGLPLGSASDANFLSSILSLSLIFAGYFVLFGRKLEKLLGLVSCALVLDVILKSMSRGTTLALMAGGGVLLFRSSGRTRAYALAAVTLGCLAALLVMGDYERGKFFDRFSTIFAPAEERDVAATSRLLFWQRALRMIAEHPMGSGGEAAFKSALGHSYVADLTSERRAVHNGYLDIAASWGIQGLVLLGTAIWLAARRLRAATAAARHNGPADDSFLAACLEAAIVVLLVAAMFLSSLRGEWTFWWVGLACSLERVFAQPATGATPTRRRLRHTAWALEAPTAGWWPTPPS